MKLWDYYATRRLRSTDVDLDRAIADGFLYIEPVVRRWEDTLKNPTVGAWITLSKVPHSFRSVRLDSPAGLKLVKSLCAM